MFTLWVNQYVAIVGRQRNTSGVKRVRFDIEDDACYGLFTKEKGADQYPKGVVDAFFEVMEFIAAARDVRDLYAMRGFRVEKLRDKKRWKRGERSLRLNDQYRLIFVQRRDESGSLLLVLGIVDYHG